MRRWAAAAIVLLLAGCAGPAPDDVPAGPATATPATPAATTGTPPSASHGAYAPPGTLRLTYIADPGQALVLRWPDGAVTVLGTSGNATRDGLAATLAALGVTTVDAFFHLGSAPWREAGCGWLGTVQVERIYHPGIPASGRPCAAAREGTTVLTALHLDPGQHVPVSAHGSAQLLATNAVPADGGRAELAVLVRHGAWSLLATGDLGCIGEGHLLATPRDAVDVVLQGFPGGSDGGCRAWLGALQPSLVLAPGERKYAPELAVRERIQAAGAELVAVTQAWHSDGSGRLEPDATPHLAPAELADDVGGGATAENGTAGPQPATVRITAVVHEEQEGAQAGTNEYAEVRNIGDLGIDVSGWTLRNAQGEIYTFPAGVFLPPQGMLRVHTGRCTPSDVDLCWPRSDEAWEGSGQAQLWDRSSLVHTFPYGPKP